MRIKTPVIISLLLQFWAVAQVAIGATVNATSGVAITVLASCIGITLLLWIVVPLIRRRLSNGSLSIPFDMYMTWSTTFALLLAIIVPFIYYFIWRHRQHATMMFALSLSGYFSTLLASRFYSRSLHEALLAEGQRSSSSADPQRNG